jgi:hypothetical protein
MSEDEQTQPIDRVSMLLTAYRAVANELGQCRTSSRAARLRAELTALDEEIVRELRGRYTDSTTPHRWHS